jgi:mono/diheme cytochrome c family protein
MGSDYDLGRMSRSVRVLFLSSTSIAVAALAAACGTERISVSKSRPILYHGAVVFSQRCSGCHTFSYAATHGSAPNVRTAMAISGPNFNVRCERPITRVLYAIENGGFSGAYMPQNIVVGQDARDVAEFVSTYAGRQAPKEPGTVPCILRPIGTLPAPVSATAATTTTAASTAAVASAPTKKPARGKIKTAHS